MRHSFAYRTDLKKKLFTFLKVLNFFLWHLFINLIDTFIGIIEEKKIFFFSKIPIYVLVNLLKRSYKKMLCKSKF